MTVLDIDIDSLFDERFDLSITDYWSLNEEEKNHITDIVINQVFLTLKREPKSLSTYLRLLDDRIQKSIYHDEYEKAEIFKRIRYGIFPL
jgi:hypothetical protein